MKMKPKKTIEIVKKQAWEEKKESWLKLIWKVFETLLKANLKFPTKKLPSTISIKDHFYEFAEKNRTAKYESGFLIVRQSELFFTYAL